MKTTAPSDTIYEVCKEIASGDISKATDIISEKYPFRSIKSAGRSYTLFDSLKVFFRDGFVDRYSGKKLINPAVLRILSTLIPLEFPAHKNWKQSESHIAYWELFPTVDHLVPIARGGLDVFDNRITTSMLRNSAKSNSLLDEIGWNLHDPGDYDKWDGLTGWLIKYYAENEAELKKRSEYERHRKYIERWVSVSI